MPFRCPDCRRFFSVRTNTVLAHSQLPLLKWLHAIRMIHASRMGISRLKVARDLGITKKTAWFLMQRIREMMREDDILLAGIIEADEVYLGGKRKNKHADKKDKTGSPFADKLAVVGMKVRGGAVVAFPIEVADRATLESAIINNVEPGFVVFTDSAGAYLGLSGLGYEHDSVNHSAGEYVRYVRGKDYVTTNSIESVWAVVKKGYVGVYTWFSFKHAHRYLNESAHRLNSGLEYGWDAIDGDLRRTNGRSMPWKKLVGDNKKPANSDE